MAEKTQSRRGIVIGALAALVLTAAVAVSRQRNVPDLIVESDEGWTGEIRVAVAGEVVAPGTYTLRGDARLADLIAAAGGYTDLAARDVLNPAARVSDSQSYTVPMQPTAAPRAATATAHATAAVAAAAPNTMPTPTPLPTTPTPATTESTASAPTTAIPDDPPGTETAIAVNVGALEDVAAFVVPEVDMLAGTPDATGSAGRTRTPRQTRVPRASGASRPVAAPRATTVRSVATTTATAAATATKVNINTASQAELAALPHIGSALADRIVADRAAHGPYKQVEDLTRVQGISKRTIEELRNRITAG